MYRRRKNRPLALSGRTGLILLFLFGTLLFITYAVTLGQNYDDRASAYPPESDQTRVSSEGKTCNFWCAGCEGFCGDEGVRQGKICNVQQFERCGQLPCYVTGTCSPNGRGTPAPAASAGSATATPTRSVASQSCPCGGALCGTVHDNVDICRKVVCTDEGWRDLGSATNRSCQPDSSDNGTCGDNACSNGESLQSCPGDCISLLTAPGNVARMVGPEAESVEAIPASFNNPFFGIVARFYNLSPYELFRLFSGGVRSFVSFLQQIGGQQQETAPAQDEIVSPAGSIPVEGRYHFTTISGCVPADRRDRSALTQEECLDEAEEYNRSLNQEAPVDDPNEGTYGIVDGECVPQRGTMSEAACNLLIMPLPGQ